MDMTFQPLFIGILLLTVETAYADSRLNTALFSRGDVSGWQQQALDGETSYRITQIMGLSVLEAVSNQSASLFYYPLSVDLEKTPILNWSWLKQQTIDPGNESDKSGDDYVARIYVIKKGGLLFWKTRAINYVWSFQHKKNDRWGNPFAGNKSKMLAQRDASDVENTWFYESRNVRQDFKRLFSENITAIDGVAIMTDSDNSAQKAAAFYGDIYFTAE